jgi:hypothetical protein
LWSLLVAGLKDPLTPVEGLDIVAATMQFLSAELAAPGG